MSLRIVRSLMEEMAARRVVLIHAASWTALLTATVAVASLAPEIAFVAAISPSSFSRPCTGRSLVRIPLNDPTEVLCFPARMVRRSAVDFFVPTVFAALVVAASACVVRSFCFSDAQ